MVVFGELRLGGKEEGVAELDRLRRGTVDLAEIDLGNRAGEVLGDCEADGRFL